MKVRVGVGDRTFEVEVGDLDARPIVATVEGECFEVWPEVEPGGEPVVATEPAISPVSARQGPGQGPKPQRPSRRSTGEAAAPATKLGRVVYAPLPGVIDSIVVRPGDVVTVGQELCVLEAMKMRNVIRASRGGEIARVQVSVGQHVKHNDALIEYTE